MEKKTYGILGAYHGDGDHGDYLDDDLWKDGSWQKRARRQSDELWMTPWELFFAVTVMVLFISFMVLELNEESGHSIVSSKAFVTLGLVMGAFLLCWFPFFLWWIIIFYIIIRCYCFKIIFEMPISYSSCFHKTKCFAFFFKALTFNITFIFQSVNSYLLF